MPYANSEFSAQVFSPPYLFNADGSRGCAAEHHFGAFDALIRPVVHRPDSRRGIDHRGTLIRLSSVTHAFNMSQLIYPLSFTAAGPTTTRGLRAPANANLAPPGPYMLFLINGGCSLAWRRWSPSVRRRCLPLRPHFGHSALLVGHWRYCCPAVAPLHIGLKDL